MHVWKIVWGAHFYFILDYFYFNFFPVRHEENVWCLKNIGVKTARSKYIPLRIVAENCCCLKSKGVIFWGFEFGTLFWLPLGCRFRWGKTVRSLQADHRTTQETDLSSKNSKTFPVLFFFFMVGKFGVSLKFNEKPQVVLQKSAGGCVNGTVCLGQGGTNNARAISPAPTFSIFFGGFWILFKFFSIFFFTRRSFCHTCVRANPSANPPPQPPGICPQGIYSDPWGKRKGGGSVLFECSLPRIPSPARPLSRAPPRSAPAAAAAHQPAPAAAACPPRPRRFSHRKQCV